MNIAQLNAFKDAFVLTATGESDNVGTSDIKRKMLAIYIKDGNKSGASYEMLGYKQESMAVGSNYDSSDMTDVTGTTYTDINSKSEKIEMSEYHVNPAKTAFIADAIKLKATDQEEKMQNYSVLIVYGFLREDGTLSSGALENHCFAIEETGCTVVLDNEGGQGFMTEDLSITLSGIKKYGTVAEITASPTFTEYVPTP